MRRYLRPAQAAEGLRQKWTAGSGGGGRGAAGINRHVKGSALPASAAHLLLGPHALGYHLAHGPQLCKRAQADRQQPAADTGQALWTGATRLAAAHDHLFMVKHHTLDCTCGGVPGD